MTRRRIDRAYCGRKKHAKRWLGRNTSMMGLPLQFKTLCYAAVIYMAQGAVLDPLEVCRITLSAIERARCL